MKRICVFNGYYIPAKNYGGPLTSIVNVVNSCCKEFDFFIVCQNHDFNSDIPFCVETNVWVPVGNAKVMYLPDNKSDFSIKRLNAILDSANPDMIWFTGVLRPNIKIVASSLAKKKNIPILISPRGELDKDRVRIKGYKKIPYLLLLRLLKLYRNSYFHATSMDEIDGIRHFFGSNFDHLFLVPNVSITKQPLHIRDQKKAGYLNALFFSRIHPVKNLLFAIEALAYCKNNISLDVYGPIEDNSYWKKCLDAIGNLCANVSVQYKGIITKDELSDVIQDHDCLLFPTINENYGHVIAETLANSRPVIISKGTTPWDSIDGVAGYSIGLNELSRFSECLDNLAAKNNDEFSSLIESTSSFFDTCPLVRNAVKGHINMFNSVISSS